MQTQMPCSAMAGGAGRMKGGASPRAYNANAAVLPSVDFIKAAGGSGGITLMLTRGVYPTGSPASPTFLYQTYYARRDDAGAGAVVFVDSNGALFNGQASWELLDQYEWAIFIWDGTGWNVIGN